MITVGNEASPLLPSNHVGKANQPSGFSMRKLALGLLFVGIACVATVAILSASSSDSNGESVDYAAKISQLEAENTQLRDKVRVGKDIERSLRNEIDYLYSNSSLFSYPAPAYVVGLRLYAMSLCGNFLYNVLDEVLEEVYEEFEAAAEEDVVCPVGYVATDCAEVDECAENMHECSYLATCTNTEGSYDCTCNDGYQGDGFDCIDANECTDGSHNCALHSTCINIEGSFECECDQGFTGDGYTCDDINECADPTTCSADATCHNLAPNYVCECNSGYSGDGYNSCSDVDECSDSTPQHGCQDTAVCVNTDGSYSCACNEGFENDAESCVDSDECADGTHHCSANAECINEAGTYACACHPGYYGDGEVCSDQDECLDMTHDCAAAGHCVNTEGSYDCECKSGYTGDGFECVDVNECSNASDSACDPAATCTNYDGGFYCECDEGYEGDGFVCSDIDECATGTSECDSDGAVCTNTAGGHECHCAQGFEGDGYVCAEIDECSNGVHNCAEVATCFDTYGSFECSCPCERCVSEEGFYFAELDSSGIMGLPTGIASSTPDSCCYSCDSSDNCAGWSFSDGMCYLVTSTDNKIASDEFVSGYINHDCSYSGDGVTCDDVNECEEGTHTCVVNLGETCINEYGGYTCECTNPDENGQCVPPVSDGPLLHYKFDEWEGDVVHDASGNGYDGVTAGFVEWTKTDGVYYGGVHFNGMGTIVVPTESLSAVEETGEITVALWIKGDDVQPIATTIFEARDGSSNRILNSHLPWSNSYVYWDCGAYGSSYDRLYAYAAEELYEGEWHHYAFTKNVASGEMKIFVDGALWASITGKTFAIENAYTFRIGSSYNEAYEYYGQMDDFRIYKYALSAEQIQKYVIGDSAGNDVAGEGYGDVATTPAPVLHYTLDEDAGLTVHDAAGDYDGSIAGGAKWATTSGYYGGALHFDAQGTIVMPPEALTSVIENQEISVSMWVYGADVNPVADTLFEGRDGSSNRVLNVHLPWSNEYVYWDCGNSGSSYDRIYQITSSDIYEGSWHHWTFTKSVSTGVMEIYLDGEVFHYGTNKYFEIHDVSNFRLGSAYNDMGYRFTGTVDDFRIYDRALSREQIHEVMAASTTDSATSGNQQEYTPILHYKLDQTYGSNVPDSSGRAMDGDIAGGITWEPASGKHHGAIHNDADGTIVIPNEAFAPVINSNEITITMWIYGDDSQPIADTVFEGRTSSAERVINAHLPWSNGYAYWDAGNYGTSYDRIYYTMPADQYKGGWHFVAMTKNVAAGTMSMFVDDYCLVYGTNKYWDFAELEYLRLGSAYNDYYMYSGSIDDFRMYDVALDPTSIAAIYESSPSVDSQADSSIYLPEPIVHYSFDEGSGAVVHEDASGYDAELQGSYEYVAGMDGTAIHFSGSGNVKVPADAVKPLDKYVTVTCWFKGDSTQPLADTLFEGRDINNNRVINAHVPWSDENLYWDAGHSGSSYDRVYVHVDSTVYKESWHFLSLVKDAEAGTQTIYIDGEAIKFLTHKEFAFSNDIATFRIGSAYNDYYYYSGAIDEFTIYDTILSQEQIELAMNQ
eukprot:Rmarinus@m.21884